MSLGEIGPATHHDFWHRKLSFEAICPWKSLIRAEIVIFRVSMLLRKHIIFEIESTQYQIYPLLFNSQKHIFLKGPLKARSGAKKRSCSHEKLEETIRGSFSTSHSSGNQVDGSPLAFSEMWLSDRGMRFSKCCFRRGLCSTSHLCGNTADGLPQAWWLWYRQEVQLCYLGGKVWFWYRQQLQLDS